MAKKYDSNFLTIEGTCKEFLSVGMGGGDLIDHGMVQFGPLGTFHHLEFSGGKYILCDQCNAEVSERETCYYVAALNHIFCKGCFANWQSFANQIEKKPEDCLKEEHYFSLYAKQLGL